MKNKIELNEILLSIGTLTSKIGNIIFDYACKFYFSSLNQTGFILLAIYQSSETIISIILNLFGGLFADKGNKKKILILSDLICAISCFFLYFFRSVEYIAYLLICVNLILAIVSTFNSPSAKAIIKFSIKADNIKRYNSFINAFTEGLRVATPFVAIIILKVFNFRFTFLFNGFTFLISALCEAKLILLLKQPSKTSIKSISIFKEIREGFIYVNSNREIKIIIGVSSVINFFLAGYNLFLPFSNNIFVEHNKSIYGFLLSSEAIGGILGSFCCSKIRKDTIKKIMYMLLLCGISIILFYICIFLKLNFYFACIAIILFGMFLAIFNILFFTFIQNNTDQEYIGRVFSIIFTVAVLFMPIGSAFFSIVFSSNSKKQYLLIGLGIMLTSFVGLILNKKNKSVHK